MNNYCIAWLSKRIWIIVINTNFLLMIKSHVDRIKSVFIFGQILHWNLFSLLVQFHTRKNNTRILMTTIFGLYCLCYIHCWLNKGTTLWTVVTCQKITLTYFNRSLLCCSLSFTPFICILTWFYIYFTRLQLNNITPIFYQWKIDEIGFFELVTDTCPQLFQILLIDFLIIVCFQPTFYCLIFLHHVKRIIIHFWLTFYWLIYWFLLSLFWWLIDYFRITVFLLHFINIENLKLQNLLVQRLVYYKTLTFYNNH